MTKLFALMLMISVVWMISVLPGCTPNAPNDLDKLDTVDITIKGQKFRLWIADDTDKQARGLMFVTADQMKPLPDGTERGMIFVFPSERHLSFWMRNTIVPLDIAYLDRLGIVVSIYTMAPLDDRFNQYPSRRPAKYAIEVNADRFHNLGLTPGDQIEIPDSLR